MRAIVAGATGATGHTITQQLLQDSAYTAVTALTRRPMEKSHFGEVGHEKLTIQNFDETIASDQEYKETYSKFDVAYCCLGAQPHTEEADYIAPTKFANYCERVKVPRMLLISAGGTNDSNSWFSYPRTIGRREDYFKQRNFSLAIFRPGLILRGQFTRTPERIWGIFLPAAFKIDMNTIGKAAVTCFKLPQVEKYQIYENEEIKKLASQV